MPRQLWLLRHGEAEPHGTRPDPERRLTPRGEEQARSAGLALAAMGAESAVILTSPKVRALETARLAAAAWDGEPVVDAALAAGYRARDALDALAAVGSDGRVLVVGHEPDLSSTVAELTGGRIHLKKGGLAIVAVAGGGGQLLAVLRPRDLARQVPARLDRQ